MQVQGFQVVGGGLQACVENGDGGCHDGGSGGDGGGGDSSMDVKMVSQLV
jgi:hypothetical protein